VRIRNSTIADFAVTVVLDSRYHSRATLVKWLGHVTLRFTTSTASRLHNNPSTNDPRVTTTGINII